MSFGVLLVWGMRGGLRMARVGCVEFDGVEGIPVAMNINLSPLKLSANISTWP